MGSKTSRMEQIRQILGLNKTEFAASMGVTPSYYYNILNGKGASNLRLEHLESLLERHSVNPAWILTGQGEPFLNTRNGSSQWIADHIIPEIPLSVQIDDELLTHLVNSVVAASGLPILSSDLAYGLAVRFGKYYIGKYPDATRDNLDIPSLTASFLTLLQTVQSLVDATFELDQQGKVVVQFGERYYNFVRQAQPGK